MPLNVVFDEPRAPWLGLRRRQLVELEDLPWFPAAWRDAGTAFLAIALRLSGQAAIVAERLAGLVAATGEDRVLDLGSGGGGPMAVVAACSPAIRVHLTDLHPNLAALATVAEASGGQITFSADPVDATAVPTELPGLRTMTNAFHHLSPSAARAVLQSAVDAGRPIAVFEVVSRSPLLLLAILAAPLSFALTLPLQRPTLALALLTYVVPVLPAFVLWDGVVSWLRIYHPEELAALVGGLERADGWTARIGSLRLGGPARGVVLELLPPRRAA